MTAYDKTLLDNTFFIENAENLKDGGFLTHEQFVAAKSQTPVLKTHRNLLVRFGFLLLGMLLYSSIVGAISLFVFTIFPIESFDWAIYLYALIGWAGSEFLARQDFFAHGLDDAFVLGLVVMSCGAVGVSSESATVVCLALAVLGTVAAWRYLHTISAWLALFGLVGFFCCLSFDLEIVPKMYVPFIGLLLAIGIYGLYYRLQIQQQEPFYNNILQTMQVFSLVLAYVSTNYLVVRELSVNLMQMEIAPGQDIPLAWIFYVLTFAIPIGYLWMAIRIKNKPMLWIGALALVCSLLTMHHYYGLLLAESALILAGILLFATAYLLIRKLRHKESGITFERDRHSDKNTLLYAQAILVNSQISVAPTASDTGDMPFGGGGFSGGGSSETF